MTTSRRGLRWWVTTVGIPATILGAFAVYLTTRREELAALGDVPASSLLLVAALAAFAHFLNSLEFRVLYRAVGTHVGVTENWMLYTAGQVGNHLPAQLGTVYRFRYLKAVHSLSYASATAAYGANFVITVLATGVAGLTGCLLLGLSEGTWSLLLTGGLVGLVVVSTTASLLPLPRWGAESRVGRAWAGIGKGWDSVRTDRTAAATVLGIELTRYALTAWRLQITFGWLDYDEPYGFFLVIGPVAALATFIGLTPAGLGLRELTIAASAVMLGRTFDAGLLGSTTDRAINLAVVTVFGLIGLLYTSHRLQGAGVADPETA
ncbi:MAG: hypothetical protein GY698_11975 [Actinomycetia bacterium]|nr:hypothetical protein [Actinomycetes bacterium]